MIGGEGIDFWAGEVSVYYVMSSQLVNFNFGYGYKMVIKAIQDQAERLAYSSPSFAIDVRSQMAKMICDLAPRQFGTNIFALGGSDANENAISSRECSRALKIFSRYFVSWIFLRAAI
jgi:taurine--2-oxoglutarate transaminase